MEEFYKKKIIRDFLSLFSQSKWKNLCVLCIEYGILQLKKNYQVSSLSMDDIEQFVDELIEEDKKKQKNNLKKFEIKNPKLSNNSQVSTVSNNRPSSNWRKGDTKTIFDSPVTPEDYYEDPEFAQRTEESFTRTADNRTSNTYGSRQREKILDDILYPRKKQVSSHRDEDMIFGNTQQRTQNFKKTNYHTNYKKSFVRHDDSYYQESRDRRMTHSNSNSNMKFKSGLQMLKMRTPSKKTTNVRATSSKGRYEGRLNNVPSKIKSQIESDKKIYEMLKNRRREDKKSFEEKESSITYRKSEMSFEDDFNF